MKSCAYVSTPTRANLREIYLSYASLILQILVIVTRTRLQSSQGC
eukprot:UN22646